jgi:hypothetical protein
VGWRPGFLPGGSARWEGEGFGLMGGGETGSGWTRCTERVGLGLMTGRFCLCLTFRYVVRVVGQSRLCWM